MRSLLEKGNGDFLIQKTKFTNSARYKCLEYLKRQSVDLYLSYCGIEECDPEHAYGPIQRSEYLLHYVLSGKGTYTVNEQTYELKNDQLFLICPDVTTYYVADKENPWTYLWIGFNGIKASTYLHYANLDENNLVSEFHHPEILINYIHAMLEARELTYTNELKREANLLLFLSALIDGQHGSESNPDSYDYPYQVYVEHALEFIEHNYEKNIKITDIANYIGINRSYLTNSFKKALNLSPQEYLINYKLDKACTLLRTTSLSINAISACVGYEDPLTFSKIFKRFKGSSPKEYRGLKEEIIISSSKYDSE